MLYLHGGSISGSEVKDKNKKQKKKRLACYQDVAMASYLAVEFLPFPVIDTLHELILCDLFLCSYKVETLRYSEVWCQSKSGT